jgi:hypothetical protein
MGVSLDKAKGQIAPTAILLILGIVYMALVTATFAFNIDLANNKIIQYVLHITVILSAFAYLFFIDMIYSTGVDRKNGRLALIFAALFTIPILIGRGIGIAYIGSRDSNIGENILNFYAPISISRSIELLSWTVLYPLSMLFLYRLFRGMNKGAMALAWLCLLSSICCFVAFISFFSTNAIYLYIGLLGWGVLFIMVIITYLIKQMRDIKNEA